MFSDITITDGNTLAIMAVVVFVSGAIGVLFKFVWKHTYEAMDKRVCELSKSQDDLKKDMRDEMGTIDRRLSMLLGALMGRGQVSAGKMEFGDFHSPFVATEKGKALIPDELFSLIKKQYDEGWHKLGDRELQEVIMEHFDSALVDEVCIPNQLSEFQCIPIIASMLRGGEIKT